MQSDSTHQLHLQLESLCQDVGKYNPETGPKAEISTPFAISEVFLLSEEGYSYKHYQIRDHPT